MARAATTAPRRAPVEEVVEDQYEDDALGDGEEVLGLLQLDDDLSTIEKPAVLPKGRYPGEVTNVTLKTSGKGNKYYDIEYTVSPDNIPADLVDQFEEGAVLHWNRQLRPRNAADRRALYNLRKLLENLSLPTNTNVVDPSDWLGCSSMLVVRVTPYNGEDRAEIASLQPMEAEPARGRTRAAPAATGRRGQVQEPAEDEPETEVEEVEEAPAPRRAAPAAAAGRRRQ